MDTRDNSLLLQAGSCMGTWGIDMSLALSAHVYNVAGQINHSLVDKLHGH